MREIKFRAWDGDNRYMAHFEPWWFTQDDEHNGLVFRGDQKEQGSPNNQILMQYTGLKDKNGVEIYEGDIVSVLGVPAEVYFMDGAFTLRRKEMQNGALVKDIFDQSPFEVIGNIYETPELLENKQ